MKAPRIRSDKFANKNHSIHDQLQTNPNSNHLDTDTTSANLAQYLKNQNQLNILLQSFLAQNLPQNAQNGHPKPLAEMEPRDRSVFISPPATNDAHALEEWIQQVTKTVCSSAFNSYLKGDMNYEQVKIYCSENIMKNIATLNKKHQLNNREFEIISKHLTNYVLPYLSKKYPLTASSQVNKKLFALVREIDNLASVENNFFTNSDIVFEYRQSGIYNDLIMKVLNSLMEKTSSLTDKNLTFYQEFEQLMSEIFELVEDMDWMQVNEDESKLHVRKQISHVSRVISAEEGQSVQRNWMEQMQKKKKEKQHYKAKVKQYTSFLIGRKIPEAVPNFHQDQIAYNKITIHHPSILRILTKWCEELWEKFQDNFFSKNSDDVKVQRGDAIHHLLTSDREEIDEYLAKEKIKINEFLKELEEFNFELQSLLLNAKGENQHHDIEKECGKFSYKVVDALHNQIIQYLNKLIHSILKVAQKFYTQESKVRFLYLGWTSPPNFLTFKIGDLMRCKFSSKQREVLRIYKEIVRISQQNPQILKIVRIKNRLKHITNDILINVKFNNSFTCEIQLAINTEITKFNKCSNNFHHYLYELQRSPFGPLIELCSVWMSLDSRSQIYSSLLQQSLTLKEHSCGASTQELVNNNKKFICSRCNGIYLHKYYILKHKRCTRCNYKLCASCLTQTYDFQHLKSLLFNKDQVRQVCSKLIKKIDNIKEIEHGMSIFIQSGKPIIKYFKPVSYKNRVYLINKKDIQTFQEIADISTPALLYKFRQQHILISLKNNYKMLAFARMHAIVKYILPNQTLHSTYKKQKEIINLSLIIDENKVNLSEQECKEILMKGTEQQRRKIKVIVADGNKFHSLPFSGKQFPNVESLILSHNNFLTSYSGLQTLDNLKQYIFQGNSPKMPTQLLKATKLQTLIIQRLNNVPPEFIVFKNLKTLSLNFGHLNNQSLKIICNCFEIKWLHLQANEFTQIPKEIANLRKLEIFRIPLNKLTSIPDQVFGLPLLKQFSLISNKNLALLPQSIQNCVIHYINSGTTKIPPSTLFQIKTLRRLRARNLELPEIQINSRVRNCSDLQSLQIYNNILTSLSPEIAQCKKLKRLQLQSVSLSSLPSFFYQIRSLQDIDLSSNKLSKLDNSVFHEMHNLKVLNLSKNQLQELPDLSLCTEMVTFDISSNKLKAIPQVITVMTYLQKLNVSQNPINVIPSFLEQLENVTEFSIRDCSIKQVNCLHWLRGKIAKDYQFVLQREFTIQKKYIADQVVYEKWLKFQQRRYKKPQGTQIKLTQIDQEIKKIQINHQKIKAKLQLAELVFINHRSVITLFDEKIFSSYQIQIYDYQNGNYERLLQIFKEQNIQISARHYLIQNRELPVLADAKCWKCSKQLQFTFYWLNWEKDTLFGCKDCVQENVNFEQFKNHYAYKNNSILLTCQVADKKIPIRNLGNNLQPDSISKNNQNRFKCNHCLSGQGLGKARYVCLGCLNRPFIREKHDYNNLCQSCMDLYLKGDRSVKQVLEKVGHTQGHYWLRVLYGSPQGYNFF